MRFNPQLLRPTHSFGAGADPFAMPPVDPFAAPVQQSDEEALLRSFLETGSASPQAAPEVAGWTEDDWRIAALSQDPMGVRDIYDKTAQEANEADFIRQIAGIDWSAQDPASQIAAVIAANPEGFSKEGASILDLFRDINKQSQPDFSKVAGYGTAALKAYQDVLGMGGSEADAMAAVADIVNAKKSATTSKPWQQRVTSKAADAVRAIAAEARGDDFEREFNEVKRGNPNITRDQYVKDYKGAANFNEYIGKKLNDGINRLMRDYGLKQEEALGLLGVNESTAPQGQPVIAPAEAPVAAPEVPVAPQAPSFTPAKQEELDPLWEKFIDLENSMMVDAKSTNPVDIAANSELRAEQREVEKEIMKKLGLKDDRAGMKMFNELWQGRKNSMGIVKDSRGDRLANPEELVGVKPEMIARQAQGVAPSGVKWKVERL